jgi:cytochrome c oxidase cbb3-type subunit III
MRHQHRFQVAWALSLLTPALCSAQGLPNPFAGNPQAIEDGRKMFSISCATCHGQNGEGAQSQAEGIRPPDLTRGQFKAGRQDEDLFRVISEGVKGTEMPSFASIGPDQIWRLVTFVRSLSRVAPVITGNPANGETLFWGKGNCGRCHEMAGKGTRFGPDLARAGGFGRRGGAQNLKKAIVDPNDDVTQGFAVITVVTRDKKTITGLQRWLDNFSTRLVEESGVEHTFLRDEVVSVKREMRSLMPDNYGKIFSASELDDIIAYILKNRSEVNSR